ncbi:MAG: chain length determinant protein tyrosine kinase EpsG [Methylococcaceae bacterium]|jgi:chain length determinant protein tyrosine kinase EpsG
MIGHENIKAESSTSIGALLLDAGKISTADAERIIAFQKQEGMRFGDAAKALGLINEDDIQKALSYQFDYPYLAASENNFCWELVAAYQPFSAQVEALRAVRSQLISRWLSEHNTLAIVSPSRHEARSSMAANLAIVFSQLGERTLLIDADLRQPRQHELFKLKNDYGLSDVMAGRADLTVVKKISAFRDLSLLLAGTVPPNPVELISRGLKNCLQQLQNQYDVILVDTSAAEQGVDALVCSASCGASLLVVRQHQTRVDEVKRLKDELRGNGSLCLGAVIADF